MTQLLRWLITVLAVAGLAYPSISPRQLRGRSSGFSRGQRLRAASQIDRSYSAVICNAGARDLPDFENRGQDHSAAALSSERSEWPNLTPVSELIIASELPPLRQHARNTFGRAPPL